MLIAGQLAPEDAALSGPVGIAQLVGGAVNATVDTGLWFPIWQLAAIISAGLAVANLLPIPALDGGRLLFILIEKLRGRRIAPEKEGVIHLVRFHSSVGVDGCHHNQRYPLRPPRHRLVPPAGSVTAQTFRLLARLFENYA